MTECAAREPAVKGEGGGQELPPAGFPSPFHLLPSAGTVLAVASGGGGGAAGASELLRGVLGPCLCIRGTRWHVPGKDKLREASCSRGHGGGGGGHCLGCRSNCYLHHIFLPSPISALGTAGSGRQQAQRPGRESKHDKDSMLWPCMAPTPSWPGPGCPCPTPGCS